MLSLSYLHEQENQLFYSFPFKYKLLHRINFHYFLNLITAAARLCRLRETHPYTISSVTSCFLQAKCAMYWTESSKTFGKITLTFQEKELFPFYVIRKFLIEKVGDRFKA